LLLFACLALLGCSTDEGQERFRVSGAVKFDGKPIPFGEVLFTPDGAKGNSGAQGIADIRHGAYDTQGSRAPGVSGGPTIIRVMAFDDAEGKKLLCEHEFSVDLPKADATHDIDIPASAANPSTGSPEI
jgi:hypothetical protein